MWQRIQLSQQLLLHYIIERDRTILKTGNHVLGRRFNFEVDYIALSLMIKRIQFDDWLLFLFLRQVLKKQEMLSLFAIAHEIAFDDDVSDDVE